MVWIASLEVKDFIVILVEQKGGWSRHVGEGGGDKEMGGCEICFWFIFWERGIKTD